MLTCEGYTMFHGTVTVNPVGRAPFDITGTWLYKPAYNCWYVKPEGGWETSYPAEILSDFRADDM